jgi:hypothetical protein
MGNSQQVLSLIEKNNKRMARAGADSSEIEEHQKQRYEYDETYKDESSSSPQPCPVGSLKCLLSGLDEFSRTMNELEYQLDLSDTIDSGNVTGIEENEEEVYDENGHSALNNVIMLSESEGAQKVAKNFDDFHVQLCQSCSSSLPLEVENCLHRCGGLLAGSTYSLHRLRRLCYRFRKRVKYLGGDLVAKQLQINQLQDNVIILRQKADKTDECLHEMAILKEDIQNKTNELSNLQDKLNENYRLVVFDAQPSNQTIVFVQFILQVA